MTIQSTMKALLSPRNCLHYKCMGKHLGAKGQITPKRVVQSVQKSSSSKILCLSWLPASLKNLLKIKVLTRSQHFSHYKFIGAFSCHGIQSFDPICPKTLCSLFPTQMTIRIKFYQYWPTGLRDIQVNSVSIMSQ